MNTFKPYSTAFKNSEHINWNNTKLNNNTKLDNYKLDNYKLNNNYNYNLTNQRKRRTKRNRCNSTNLNNINKLNNINNLNNFNNLNNHQKINTDFFNYKGNAGYTSSYANKKRNYSDRIDDCFDYLDDTDLEYFYNKNKATNSYKRTTSYKATNSYKSELLINNEKINRINNYVINVNNPSETLIDNKINSIKNINKNPETLIQYIISYLGAGVVGLLIKNYIEKHPDLFQKYRKDLHYFFNINHDNSITKEKLDINAFSNGFMLFKKIITYNTDNMTFYESSIFDVLIKEITDNLNKLNRNN